jgi:Predicted ATPase
MSVDLQSSPGDSTTTRASSSDGRSFLVRASAGAAIRPGEYVRIIRQDGADVLGFVEEVTSHDTSGVSAAGSLIEDGSDVPPTPFIDATAEPTSPDSVARVVSGPDRELEVGQLVSMPSVGVGLVPRRLNRHTFWCGQSGSGKTYALGVALERIILRTRLPVVVFDPNSDFVKLNAVRDGVDPAVADALADRAVRVLGPGTGPDALRIRFRDMGLRAKAAILRLDPVVNRGEYNALLRLAPALQGVDAADIPARMREVGGLDGEALAQRVENLGLLEWQTWAYGHEAATDVIADRPAATVLDLGAFHTGDEQLVVALAVLEDLWARREERRPVLLVIDEAHNLCPPEPEGPLGVAVRDRIIQIAAEGRKFGLWLLLSTQRPSKVHRGIVSQCDNVTVMRMNSPGDLAELADLFGFVPRAMLAQSARFRQGEALIAGGFVAMPSIVRVRDRITPEGGIDVRVPMP